MPRDMALQNVHDPAPWRDALRRVRDTPKASFGLSTIVMLPQDMVSDPLGNGLVSHYTRE